MAKKSAGETREPGSAGIHPSAVIAPGAQLAPDVIVKPFAVIEDDVRIGAGCVIGPHAVIHSHVSLGEGNIVHAHAILGDAPQDLKYDGSPTRVEIGDRNLFREGVTVHRATNLDHPTRIGSDCFLMVNAHVGHDCEVGNRVILTNGVSLGGHVQVEDRCTLGGGSMVHQFVRIGTHAMVAGYIALRRDVIPYTLIGGEPVRHFRLNSIGLRRAGIPTARYRLLEKALHLLRENKSLTDLEPTPEITHLVNWLSHPSKRGLYPFASKTNS